MKMALTYLAPGSVSHDTLLETLQLFWITRDLQCQKRLWIFFLGHQTKWLHFTLLFIILADLLGNRRTMKHFWQRRSRVIQNSCNINLDANRSISNGPHSLCKSEKTSQLKDHSVELLIWLDSVSASTQAEPDMWQTLSQISLSVHHSQIFLAKLSHSADCCPLVFNICHCGCIVRLNPYVFSMNMAKHDFNPDKTAFSSK